MTTDSTDDHTNPAGAIVRPIRDGIDSATAKASDAAELAREKAAKALDAAKDGLDHAREALGDGYASGREKVTNLYSTGRDRANHAYTAARGRLHEARESTTERLDGNPLGALLGGLALGVALGALLPRTERETKLLGNIGNKLNGLAQDALDAAKDAGQAKLADLCLTPDKARESLHTLLDGALAAATSAGNAAVDKARTQAAADD